MTPLPTQSPAKSKYTFGWTRQDNEWAQDGIQRKHFSSPPNFAKWLTAHHANAANEAKRKQEWYNAKYPDGNKYGYGKIYTADNVYGRHLPSNAIKLLNDGNNELVPQAKALMHKLQTQLPTTQRKWQLQPVGYFPNVGAYLAGQPENMFTMERERNDNAPVNIWVNVLPSGGCSTKQLLMRGAVLVALVNLLSERRSQVSITAYADQPTRDRKGVVVSWTLPTSPLNLAQLCTSLGYADIVQSTCMYACERINGAITGGWLRGHDPGHGYDEALVRKDLGAQEEDVIVPALYYHDDCINKPVEFLHRELTRILGESDDY